MRYLAQFSEAPEAKRVQSFWQDALATEEWIGALGKSVSERKLFFRARGLRALAPWLSFQLQPIVIDAWLDPMDISVTWNYLVRFLAELGPERVWIPCGEDAWIGWMKHQIVLRASHESWVWALVEDVWDPASWLHEQELEWWSEGRIQHARRLPWGISEQRSWLTGWEEWTISEENASGSLVALWLKLVERLGARPVRVKWLQESASKPEQLLGIKARYVSCDMTITGSGVRWLEPLARTMEPTHIRTHVTWGMPDWTTHWSTHVTLRRVQRGSRLEATYLPRAHLTGEAWNELQRERRQIPILQIRPLALVRTTEPRWRQLEDEAQSHSDRDRLISYLTTYHWPKTFERESPRLRMPSGWTLNRWESQQGLWVVEEPHQVKVQIEWPTEAHPGHLGIIVEHASVIPMNEWIRESHFQRLNTDRRYWAEWISHVLLPALQLWSDSRLGKPNS